jgi:hypothetical protein
MRIPLPQPRSAYLQDHRFIDRPVLPAVEAMEMLAGAVEIEDAAIDIGRIREARFDKFLALDPDGEIELWAELATEADGAIGAALKSKRRGSRGIARTLTHASMCFGSSEIDPFAANEAADTGIGETSVDFDPPRPERIYAELIPFGPRYHNIEALTRVGTAGIRALLRAPERGGPFRLGNPFVLDAAFHAACVWGQRFAGIVAFPVGLGERQIVCPCEAGRLYEAQIALRDRNPERLVFDMDIAFEGRLCEVVRSVVMRDVSGGRLKPPKWLRPQAKGSLEASSQRVA